jgi:acyl dehydratase
MRTVGLGLCWQDLKVGDKFKTVGRTVTETDIVNFVNCTGMVEVMFTNLEYLARESVIKGRLAPAALVFALAEGLAIQATAQGTGLAFLNMELNVLKPTFAGDTIHVEIEVKEARETSKSKAGRGGGQGGNRGLVRTFNKIVNQKGEVVITYNPLRMMKGRTTPEQG